MSPAFAQTTALPDDFTVEGRLYDSTGAPLNQSAVSVMFELVSESNPTCVLYREVHSPINVSSADASSAGVFALRLGSGTMTYPGTRPSLFSLFVPGTFSGDLATAPGTSCGPFTAAAGEHRLVRISVQVGATIDPLAWDTLSPNTRISSVPTAVVAQNSLSLQGYGTSSFVMTDGIALTQANVANIFSTANYNSLLTLLAGTSTQYIPSSPTTTVSLNNQTLTGIKNPTGASDATNKQYVDANLGGMSLNLASMGTSSGMTLLWDQSVSQWKAGVPSDPTKLPLAGGAMTGNIAMGGHNLTGLGVLGLGNYTDSTEATLTAPLSASSKGLAWYNSDHNVVKVWNGTSAVQQAYLDTSGKILSSWIPNTSVTAATYGTSNQVPVFTVGADGRITSASTVAISGVAPSGTASGDLTGSYPSPSIAANAVTTAKISNDSITSAKISSTGIAINRLIATDGTSGTTLGYLSCPTNNQILSWNSATGWTCTTVASLSPVTSVAGKTGAVTLNAADISGLGNAATQNYGTSASDLVQLNASAQLPPVDGSLLTNVNAAKLQSQPVASTTPVTGQVLLWNGSLWIPSNASTGTVTAINTGVGLNGGPITSTGTLSVNVGTGSSQIPQLNTSAQLALANGSASSPSFSFASSSTTGLFSPSANSVALVTNGNSAITVTSTGNVGIGTVNPASSFEVKGGLRLLGSTSGYAGFQPAAIAGSTVWTLPSSDGTNGQVLMTNGSGVLSWTSTSGGTSVSVTSPITNTGTALAPNIGIQQATSAQSGYLSSTDWSTFNSKLDPTLASGKIWVGNGSGSAAAVAVSGDISMTNAGVATVTSLQGKAVSATAPTTAGQVLRWDGTSSYVPSSIQVGDLPAGVASQWVSAGSNIGYTVGNVGIGTTIPTAGAALDVNGVGANSALLLPRDTSASRPTGVNGMIRYNTNLNAIESFVNNSWQTMATLATSGSVQQIATGTGLLGGPITTVGTLSVNVGSAPGQIPQLSTGSQLLLADGSAGAPTYSFANNPASGLFNPGLNQLALSTSGTSALYVDSAGNIGIGTTTPSARLHVTRPSDAPSGSLASYGIYNVRNPSAGTSTSGGVYGIYNQLQLAGTTPSTGENAAAHNETQISTGNTVATAYGSRSRVFQSTNQSVTTAIGASGEIATATNNTNGMANAIGVVGSVTAATSTNITSAYALRGVLNANGGAISNGYELYLDPASGTVANPWGIYQPGTNEKNYFGGKVGLGVTPTASLHLGPGTGAASSAPLKFSSGTLLTTTEPGAIEYDGSSLYLTNNGGIRQTLALLGTGGSLVVSGTASFSGVATFNSGINMNGPLSMGGQNITNVGPGLSGTGDLSISSGASNSLNLISGGTSPVNIGSTNGTSLAVFSSSAPLANYVTINGATSGNSPQISVDGSDANINLTLASKNAGALSLQTAGVDRLHIDSAGNVGIGVTNPTAPLQLNGNFATTGVIYSPLNNANVTISSDSYPGTQTAAISVWGRSASTYSGDVHLYANTGGGATSGTIRFFNYDGTSWNPLMVVQPTGNVGIGTTGPAAQLDVYGTSTATTTGSSYGIQDNLIAAPAVAVTRNYASVQASTTITGSSNVSGTAYGLNALVKTASTYSGTLSNAVGVNALAQPSGGTVTNALGVQANAQATNTAYGEYVAATSSNLAYGIYVNAVTAGTAAYGVYINTPSGGAPVKYSLFTSGAGPVSFGGLVGIGNTSPQLPLDAAKSDTATYISSGTTDAPSNQTTSSTLSITNSVGANGPAAYLQLAVKNLSAIKEEAYIGAFSNGSYTPTLVFGARTGNLSYAERMRLDSNGNLVIGATSASSASTRLQVGSSGDGTIAIANAWNTFSDARLKNVIGRIPNACSMVDQLNGYYYTWRSAPDRSRQVGVIAQEVEAVLPELVRTGSDGIKTVDYPKLTAVLIEANKELHQKTRQLEQENQALKAAINKQNSRLDAIEKRLNGEK